MCLMEYSIFLIYHTDWCDLKEFSLKRTSYGGVHFERRVGGGGGSWQLRASSEFPHFLLICAINSDYKAVYRIKLKCNKDTLYNKANSSQTSSSNTLVQVLWMWHESGFMLNVSIWSLLRLHSKSLFSRIAYSQHGCLPISIWFP